MRQLTHQLHIGVGGRPVINFGCTEVFPRRLNESSNAKPLTYIKLRQTVQCTELLVKKTCSVRTQQFFQCKSNKYYIFRECVFVALGIQHAMHMRRIFICGLPGSKIHLHIILQTPQFSKKKKVFEHKMCVFIFFTTLYRLHHIVSPFITLHFIRISFYRTDNHRQWNAVGSPDDGHKDARNMLR